MLTKKTLREVLQGFGPDCDEFKVEIDPDVREDIPIHLYRPYGSFQLRIDNVGLQPPIG